MKRSVLIVISCLLLLGLLGMVLAGCGGEARVVGNGTQVCVFPKAAAAPYSAAISLGFLGINWTDVEYSGTGSMVIPAWMVTAWGLW